MITTISQFRTFDRASQVLMVNQFGINVGFYMLMPYLSGYLAGPLGLAAWTVGLILGCGTSPSRACSLSVALLPIDGATNR